MGAARRKQIRQAQHQSDRRDEKEAADLARKLEELNRRHLGGIRGKDLCVGELIPVREEMNHLHCPCRACIRVR